MKILVASNTFPFPPRNGVELPIAELIKSLRTKHDVYFALIHDDVEPEPLELERKDRTAQWVRDVFTIRAFKSVWFLGALKELLFREPFYWRSRYDRQKVMDELRKEKFDVVWCCPDGIGGFGTFYRREVDPSVRLGLGINEPQHTVFSHRFQKAVRGRDNVAADFLQCLRWPFIYLSERSYLGDFDVIQVQTEKEKARTKRLLHGSTWTRVVVAPNGLKEDLRRITYRRPREDRILFMTHLTGTRRAESKWFLKRVWPEVRRSNPRAEVWLVGEPAAPALAKQLNAIPGVRLIGFVGNLAKLYESVTLAIVPIIQDHGLINRAMDAMTAGVPVVGCPEPMSTIDGFRAVEHGIVASSAKDMAAAIVALLADNPRLHDLSREAQALASRHPTWGESMGGIERALAQSLLERPVGAAMAADETSRECDSAKPHAIDVRTHSRSWASKTIDIRVDGLDAAAWHSYVRELDDLSLMQVWEFGAAKARPRGWKVQRMVFSSGDTVLGVAQVLVRQVPLFGRGLAYVSRGPLLRDAQAASDPGLLREMLRALRAYWVNQRRYYLRVALNLPDAPASYALAREAGFERAGTITGWSSAVLDLSRPLDELRSGLEKKWRNCLGKAERAGLEVQVGVSDELFSGLIADYQALLARKGFKPAVTPQFLRRLQAKLPENRRMIVFTALHHGERHGSILVAPYGRSCMYLVGGTLEAGRATNANYLLLWTAIREMQARGFRSFDLGGVDTERTADGVLHFKEGMGGEHYTLMGPVVAANGDVLSKVIGGFLRRRDRHGSGLIDHRRSRGRVPATARFPARVDHGHTPDVSLKRGIFTISLDTELAWGRIADHDLKDFYEQLAQKRHIVRTLIRLFEKYNIPATWAIVGRLFERPPYGWRNDPKKSVERFYPGLSDESVYDSPILNDELNSFVRAPDLVELIRASPVGHEIGSHSFNHIVFGGSDPETAEADLQAAVAAAREWGITMTSFIFPRNSIGHCELLVKHGFKVYRGVDADPPSLRRCPELVRMIARQVDLLLGTIPMTVLPIREHGGLVNIPGSLLYRIPQQGLRRHVPVRVLTRRACAGLEAAAAKKEVFHLWFHPFNFGYKMEEHFAGFEEVLRIASAMRAEGRLDVCTMQGAAEAAALAEGAAPGVSSVVAK